MRLVVLGDPVDHSLSPLLHTSALRAAGIAGSYDRCRVDLAGMRDAVARIAAGDLDGANVTMPHKRLVAELADVLAGDAVRTGVVNTLTRVGDDVVGHNTDVAGIRRAWEWACLPADAPLLLLGAGGAASAAVAALDGHRITVAARRPDTVGRLDAVAGEPLAAAPWGSPGRGAVVVNATPIGIHGEELPAGTLDGALGIFDMAYGPAPTPAVGRGEAAGVPVADGPAMLLGQAMESFRLWTGHPAPLEAMQRALAAEVGRSVGAHCS